MLVAPVQQLFAGLAVGLYNLEQLLSGVEPDAHSQVVSCARQDLSLWGFAAGLTGLAALGWLLSLFSAGSRWDTATLARSVCAAALIAIQADFCIRVQRLLSGLTPPIATGSPEKYSEPAVFHALPDLPLYAAAWLVLQPVPAALQQRPFTSPASVWRGTSLGSKAALCTMLAAASVNALLPAAAALFSAACSRLAEALCMQLVPPAAQFRSPGSLGKPVDAALPPWLAAAAVVAVPAVAAFAWLVAQRHAPCLRPLLPPTTAGSAVASGVTLQTTRDLASASEPQAGAVVALTLPVPVADTEEGGGSTAQATPPSSPPRVLRHALRGSVFSAIVLRGAYGAPARAAAADASRASALIAAAALAPASARLATAYATSRPRAPRWLTLALGACLSCCLLTYPALWVGSARFLSPAVPVGGRVAFALVGGADGVRSSWGSDGITIRGGRGRAGVNDGPSQSPAGTGSDGDDGSYQDPAERHLQAVNNQIDQARARAFAARCTAQRLLLLAAYVLPRVLAAYLLAVWVEVQVRGQDANTPRHASHRLLRGAGRHGDSFSSHVARRVGLPPRRMCVFAAYGDRHSDDDEAAGDAPSAHTVLRHPPPHAGADSASRAHVHSEAATAPLLRSAVPLPLSAAPSTPAAGASFTRAARC
jgi:hypothetical protein